MQEFQQQKMELVVYFDEVCFYFFVKLFFKIEIKDCNHFQVSESIWNYFYSIYGGGPELLIRSNSNSNVDDQISLPNKPAVTFV